MMMIIIIIIIMNKNTNSTFLIDIAVPNTQSRQNNRQTKQIPRTGE
jgi:hypothetical protein